jgi:excisionase family DNA binding protein
MDMAEHHEQQPRGNQSVGAQAADHDAAGPNRGSQDGVGSGSGTTIDSDRLLTVAQIVELTGYSEESIRRWIRKGALPIERVGPYGRVRVRFSVLRQLFPR